MHSPRPSGLWRVLFCCLMFSVPFWHTVRLWAQSDSPVQCTVTSGLAGLWKVGFDTRHEVTIQSAKALRATVQLQTVDGDGVPVTYRNDTWTVDLADGGSQRVEVIAKHGRSNRPIRIQLLDPQGALLVDRLLTESERGSPLPAHQPWIVGIGSELRLADAAMKSVGLSYGEYSVSELTRSVELASQAAAYAGVDVILFSSSNADLNASFTEPQRQAIESWVRTGGYLVLTWGRGAPSLAAYPEFTAMLPGELVGTASDCEPSPIESLLGSQQQLQPLECALLRMNSGRVDVGTVTATRVKLPFIARWAYGFGNVLWMATELDSPQILAWDTRSGLLKYLFKEAWEKKDGKPGIEAFLAYEDLSGQLNASLDAFPSLRLGNLGQLVLIAGLLALIIGPFDYFVVSKYWKRPRWTWWTLCIASTAIMIFASGLTQAWKPDLPSINYVELIDVDDQTNTLHGRAFAHTYSGRRGIYDFLVHHRSLSAQSTREAKPGANRIDWFGQPGKGLGGFDSNVSTQLGLPAYEVHATSDSSSALDGIGFPAAGTKAFFSDWSESIELDEGGNALSTISGKDDLLQGSFTNPLGVELLDATLYFAGRSYTIPARIRPGERVPITTTIPKDIARRLQRRTFVAGEEQGVEWNPADTGSIERLMELLSFHQSAGAAAYTGLSHRYLSKLDCSDLLKLERAIVFGFVAEPVTSWTLRRNEIPVQAIGGKQRSVVRLALQVQNNNPSSSPSREYPIPTP